MTLHDPLDEHGYDDVRLAQWRAGQAAGTGFTRRDLARLTAGLSLVAGVLDSGPILCRNPRKVVSTCGGDSSSPGHHGGTVRRPDGMRRHGAYPISVAATEGCRTAKTPRGDSFAA